MTTYYVSTTGDNGGNGSASSPWRTIGHAMNADLKPGDEVIVRPGTYNEQVTLSRSGSEDNHIVLRSEVPGEALIRPPAGAWNAVNVYANYVTVDGFDISGTGGGDGIEANNVHHIDILNNTVHGNGESGIQFNWSDFIRIEGNTTYDNASDGWFSGISIYQNRNITGDTDTSGYRTIVRNNVSYGNVTETGLHTDGNGIIIDDFQSTQTSGHPNYNFPTLVENNLVYNNGGKGIAVHWSDQVTVRNNTAYHNNQDNRNDGTWRGEFSNQDSNNNTWVNNIAVADPSVNPNNTAIGFYGNNDNVTWANNLTYNGRAGDASLKLDGGNAAPRAEDGNLLGVNPQFVNAPNDFRLQEGSAAVDAGTESFGVGASDLDGDARAVGRIDLGVFEFGSASTEPPVTEPPATEPPATEPPATEPPATEPPATEPPATEPPATEPPATEPPATEPPATEPPATEPPATKPPADEGHSLWNDSTRPAHHTAADPDSVEVGTKFRTDADGEITAIRFYRGPENDGSLPVNFWAADGTLLGSARAADSGAGWQEVVLDRPIAVSSGDVSVASYHAAGGKYSYSNNYFSQEVDQGPLTALKDGGVFSYGAKPSFPDESYQSNNYWVDVVFTQTEATHAGSGGRDSLRGTGGEDVMLGGTGNDNLRGNGGDDVLRGQAGNDVLIGGAGSDVLIGGRGADTFRFVSLSHSQSRNGIDEIRAGDGALAMEGVGRPGGDVIDLRSIDADSTVRGNQGFDFRETGKGGLWLEDRDGATVVYGNVDNDAEAEFELVIQDGGIAARNYVADDFLL